MLTGAALAGLLLLTQAASPTAQDQEPTNTVEGVEVRARPLDPEAERKAISEFVRGLSSPTQRGRLARWEKSVCPAVIGLSQRHGTYIADRIAVEAQALGLETGQPGCRANIFILFSGRADETAAQFRRQAHYRFFAHIDERGAVEKGGGDQGLRSFLSSSRPVRWWHVAAKTGADGQPADRGELRLTTGSRLASSWREDITRVLMIVDTTQTRGVTYEALASYLVMGALAQLDPDPAAGRVDSITTLFADRDAGRSVPETLTAEDRAYLRGLYASPADAKSLNVQRGAIRRSLQEARARALK